MLMDSTSSNLYCEVRLTAKLAYQGHVFFFLFSSCLTCWCTTLVYTTDTTSFCYPTCVLRSRSSNIVLFEIRKRQEKKGPTTFDVYACSAGEECSYSLFHTCTSFFCLLMYHCSSSPLRRTLRLLSLLHPAFLSLFFSCLSGLLLLHRAKKKIQRRCSTFSYTLRYLYPSSKI